MPVWAHADELSVVSHPWRYDHERSRIPYFRHPRFVKIFTEIWKGSLGEAVERARAAGAA